MSDSCIQRAVDILRRDGVIAHACEGVWGLACDPFSKKAVLNILSIKCRSLKQGFLLIGADATAFSDELHALPQTTYERVLSSWPGHTTWVVPNKNFPTWITGAFDTVAVRVPDHRQSQQLSQAFAGPLVSTSANRSGSRELLTEADVRNEFAQLVDFVLPGSIGNAVGPSRILDALTGRQIR